MRAAVRHSTRSCCFCHYCFCWPLAWPWCAARAAPLCAGHGRGAYGFAEQPVDARCFAERRKLQFLLVNRLDAIRIALAIGALTSVLAHLNLVVKQIISRNYWTRVIIFSDAALLAFAIFWIWQIYAPNFAGFYP